MPESTSDESHRLSELASRVGRAGCTFQYADAAMRVLYPTIEILAGQVAKGSIGRHPWVARDFVAASSSLIFEELRKGNYDPSKGPFKAWCHKVLSTRFISELRKEKRHDLPSLNAIQSEKDAGGHDIANAAPDVLEAVASQHYRHEPLSEADLRKIGRWPPRDRLILLSLALLWTRVDEGRWNQWCLDCGIVGPFPPADFLDQSPQQCMEIVAGAMGITLNHLYVLKHRMTGRLVDLDPDAPVVKHILYRRSSKGRRPSGGAQ